MPQLVTLTSTRLEIEAQMIKSRLEVDGIRCYLSGHVVASVVGPGTELNSSWSNPLGDVEVKVRAEDLAEARKILNSYNVEPTPGLSRSSMSWRPIFQVGAAFYLGIMARQNLQVLGATASSLIGLALFLLLVFFIFKKPRHDHHH